MQYPCYRKTQFLTFFTALFISCMNLTLFAASWSLPVEVSQSNSNAIIPQICPDSDGNVIAVWSQFDGSHYVIKSATKALSGAWSPAVTLSVPGGNAYFPQVAIDPKGNATVVWARQNKDHFVIQTSSKLKSSKNYWSDPVNLSTAHAAGEDAIAPQIAFNSKGYAIVVWQQKSGTSNIIQSCIKTNGPRWSLPQDITFLEPDGIGCIQPSLGISPTGLTIVVWKNGTSGTIEASIKEIGNNWSNPMTISDSAEQISEPDIAIDSLGNAYVVWSRNTGTDFVIETITRLANGTWQTVQPISDTGGNSIKPKISVDVGGNAYIVWHRFDGQNTIVQGSSKQQKTNWSQPFDLSDSGQDASEPQVVMGPKNNNVIIWKRSDGNNFVIQAITKFGNNSWSQPQTISKIQENAYFPQIVVDTNGNITGVWLSSDGHYTSVQSSHIPVGTHN